MSNLGDADGDGKDDIFWVLSPAHRWSYHRNQLTPNSLDQTLTAGVALGYTDALVGRALDLTGRGTVAALAGGNGQYTVSYQAYLFTSNPLQYGSGINLVNKPSIYADPNYAVDWYADVNGDGLPDLIRFTKRSTPTSLPELTFWSVQPTVFFNTGAGFSAAGVSTVLPSGYNERDWGVYIGSMWLGTNAVLSGAES